jgi:hypothetical protein
MHATCDELPKPVAGSRLGGPLGATRSTTGAPRLLATAAKPSQSAHGYHPGEVLRRPVFYALYLMFVLIAAGGLTMTASMAPTDAHAACREEPRNL